MNDTNVRHERDGLTNQSVAGRIDGLTDSIGSWTDVRSLTRTRKDSGAAYVREADVAAQLVRLAGLADRARREALVADYDGGDPLRPKEETIVYFIREYRRRGIQDVAWTLLETLVDRIAGHVSRKLARWRLPYDEQEDCIGDLTAAVCEAALSLAPGDEFWEARFWVCLDRRLYALVEKRQAMRDAEIRPGDDGRDTEDGVSGVDGIFARIADPNVSPETMALRKAALSELTELERQAVYLKYIERIPEESDDPSRQTIAKMLNVTGRTVRNYLRRAHKKLTDLERD